MSAPRGHVLSVLRQLAPEHLAESWDNVGLLVDPEVSDHFLHALLTIDLTSSTMEEAEELGVDLIVSYHPPIFSGLKRLRASQASEALVVRALRSGMTIYSPHTALDCAVGGMNDWLSQAVGEGKTRPIVPIDEIDGAGAGRIVELDREITIDEAVLKVKEHLGLSQIRLARAPTERAIRTVAVCPGAGGSVFEKVRDVDLLITGEMHHHDVLARRARGTHVILTDHTNTERGYLPHYGRKVAERCPGLSVTVSRVDTDPLVIT